MYNYIIIIILYRNNIIVQKYVFKDGRTEYSRGRREYYNILLYFKRLICFPDVGKMQLFCTLLYTCVFSVKSHNISPCDNIIVKMTMNNNNNYYYYTYLCNYNKNLYTPDVDGKILK